MQADAGLLKQGDPGAGDLEALPAQAGEELLVEGAPEAAADALGGDVDGDARVPAVDRPLLEQAGVGVASTSPFSSATSQAWVWETPAIRSAISAASGARSSKEVTPASTLGA